MKLSLSDSFKKLHIWIYGLMTVGVLGTAGFIIYIQIPQDTTEKNLKAQTVPVETKDWVIQIQANGIVQAVRRINLSPEDSGKIAKLLVNEGDTVLSQGRTVDAITATLLIVAWIVALLLATLLPPWEIAAQGNFQEKLSARINLLLMQKADTLSDLSYFEDSHFYDQLQLLREKARERSVSLLYEITVGGRELFTVVSMLGLLFPIGWWVPLIIVAATIPQTFVLMKLEEKEWEIAEGKSLQVRRMEYCASVMLTDIYAKEVRLFGFGNFLLKRFQVAFKDFHRANRKFRHQQLTGRQESYDADRISFIALRPR